MKHPATLFATAILLAACAQTQNHAEYQSSNIEAMRRTYDFIKQNCHSTYFIAPTAVNQQKFFFEYATGNKVIAKRGVSLVGYTQMDLGIVKYHFEVGAGKENFEWIK